MQSGFIEIQNGKLYYELHGQGQPIVFLHGFSLDHRMWQPQVEHFSKTNTVLTLDLRGFGKSSLPEADYAHYEDIKTVLDYLNLQKVHLVGLSMGGRIAVDFALTYPDRASSLALLDSSLGGYKSTVDWTISVENGDIEKAKEDWILHPVFDYSLKNPVTKDVLQEILADYSGWYWQNPKKFEIEIPDAKERLSEINVPTTIVVGEHDLEYFHDIARYMEQRITNSKYLKIPDAGHMSNLDNPKFVNELIENQLI